MKYSLPEFSVTELSQALKMTLEETFSYVKVRGEISGLKPHTSGHLYFNLKDSNSVLNTVCWKGTNINLSIKPEEGLEVICTGKISTYPARSNYQLIATNIEISGIGTLLAMLEQRKKKLEAEGLFDASRKKSLPRFPRVIGIITSPTGAVIKDILHRISDRFPCVHVLVYPVQVQGSTAADEVTKAIYNLNKIDDRAMKPDLLIVARGGGSIEDLWAFNEEVVVRAVANSKIPIISAIGHETDTTLIDYAADFRAPTPTAAAEIAVPVLASVLAELDTAKKSLSSSISKLLHLQESRLNNLVIRITSFTSKILEAENSMLTAGKFLTIHLKNILKFKQSNLLTLSKLLESYEYRKILKRGFGVIRSCTGKLIMDSKTASMEEKVQIEFHDGSADAQIIKAKKQGSLF